MSDRGRWTARAAVAAALAFTLFPVYWIVLTALRPRGEIFSHPVHLLPSTLTLDNLRTESPRRIHRGAGQATTGQDIHRQDQPDKEPGRRLRAACVNCVTKYSIHQKERQDNFDEDALSC